MDTPTRVLLVEDLPTDAGLAEREIQKAVKRCTFRCVDAQQDFLRELEEFKPDVVVTDYRMPQFDGLTALKLSLERAPLTPVIILTSAINEDTAVECMKAGAADYVIKEHIKRLGQAVVRSLQEQQLKIARVQAEKELRFREEQYRRFFEDDLSGVYLSSPDGAVLACNPAFVKIMGYESPEEILHANAFDFYATKTERDQWLAKLSRQRRLVSEESRLVRKDGRIIHVVENVVGVFDDQDSLIGIRGYLFDVTERRQAEERQASILQSLPIVLYAAETPSRFDATWISENAQRVTGFPAEAFLHEAGFWTSKVHPDDVERVERAFSRIRNGQEMEVEYRWKCADGSYRWFLDKATSVTQAVDGRIEYSGIWLDTTERKRVEDALRESDRLMHEIVDGAPFGAHLYELGSAQQLVFVGANRAADSILGTNNQQFIGKTIEDAFPALRQTDIPDAYRRVAITGERFDVEQVNYDDKGIHGAFEVHAFQTGPGRMATFFRDITERKKAEDALRASEMKYRQLVETMQDGMYRSTHEGRFLEVNPAMVNILGYDSKEELMAIDIKSQLYFAEEDRESAALDEELAEMAVFRLKKKDGSEIWVEDHGRHVVDDKGTVLYHEGVLRDVTERKRAEAALRESEGRYRTLVHTLPDAVAVMDAMGKITYASPAALKLFGDYTEKEVLGVNIHTWIHVLDQEKALTNMRRVLMGESVVGDEYLLLRKDGSTFFAEVTAARMQGQSDHTPGVIVLVRDISERKRAEEKIEEQARLLDVARDAIIVRDMNDKLLYLNRATQELFGWTFEEARAIASEELIAENDRGKFREYKEVFIETGEWEGELRQKTKDGKELFIQTRWTLVRDKKGIPSAWLIINRDITEKRSLEAQFRRAQRLESLGTLAGGIAHDLNNVLAPIMMSLAILDRKVTDPDLKKYITTLGTSVERGSDIVKQVLLFARGSEKDFAPQQLRYIIREITVIIQQTFSRSIELETRIEKDLAFVMGDATQLHQVLMNLCVNARDAMPDGGKLIIAASNVRLNEADADKRLGAYAGEFVVLRIADTGSGIPKEIQERIFEPFFTTKELGKGTGLGLSTVYAIVKDHKGFIDLESEQGKGTSFQIYLPAVQHKEVAKPRAETTVSQGHGESILVIDDELAVLEITREILEVRGYKVLTAENGAVAVSVFANAPKGSIRLVLTDVNMPGMDGPATIEAIRRIDPEVKVIIASGLVTDLDPVKKKNLQIQGYLMKPYTSERMLTMIHELLET